MLGAPGWQRSGAKKIVKHCQLKQTASKAVDVQVLPDHDLGRNRIPNDFKELRSSAPVMTGRQLRATPGVSQFVFSEYRDSVPTPRVWDSLRACRFPTRLSRCILTALRQDCGELRHTFNNWRVAIPPPAEAGGPLAT
jgi:hypothetical protein